MNTALNTPDEISIKILELQQRFDGREFLPLTDVMSLIGCSRQTAYRHRQAGIFPQEYKINGYNSHFRLSDVAAFLVNPPTSSQSVFTSNAPAKRGRPRKRK